MTPIELQDELIHKAMNNLNTFQCCDGELYLRGTDEYGKDFQVCFDAYDFLNWIDTEQIEYIKQQLIKHIKTKWKDLDEFHLSYDKEEYPDLDEIRDHTTVVEVGKNSFIIQVF